MFAARNSALSYPCTFMSSISAVLLQRMSVCKAKNVSFLVQHRTKSYHKKQTAPKVINVAFGSKKEQSWPCRQETWERSTLGIQAKPGKQFHWWIEISWRTTQRKRSLYLNKWVILSYSCLITFSCPNACTIIKVNGKNNDFFETLYYHRQWNENSDGYVSPTKNTAPGTDW